MCLCDFQTWNQGQWESKRGQLPPGFDGLGLKDECQKGFLKFQLYLEAQLSGVGEQIGIWGRSLDLEQSSPDCTFLSLGNSSAGREAETGPCREPWRGPSTLSSGYQKLLRGLDPSSLTASALGTLLLNRALTRCVVSWGPCLIPRWAGKAIFIYLLEFQLELKLHFPLETLL